MYYDPNKEIAVLINGVTVSFDRDVEHFGETVNEHFLVVAAAILDGCPDDDHALVLAMQLSLLSATVVASVSDGDMTKVENALNEYMNTTKQYVWGLMESASLSE